MSAVIGPSRPVQGGRMHDPAPTKYPQLTPCWFRSHVIGAQMYGRGAPSTAFQVIPGHCVWNFGSPWKASSDRQLSGSLRSGQNADQPDIMYRCDGRVHESTGANMWSNNV